MRLHRMLSHGRFHKFFYKMFFSGELYHDRFSHRKLHHRMTDLDEVG